MKKLVMMAVAMVAVTSMALAQDAAVAAPVAVKEESPDTGFSFDLTLDIYSAYVWRGAVVSDRPVWQPAGTVSYATADYGTFSAGVWANFDITDRNGYTRGAGLNEVDYTLSYSIDVSDFTLEAGHIWYTFPETPFGSTREVYASVAYNNDIVTPSLAVYYDYAEVDGVYAIGALNKEFALSDQLTLGLDVSLGAGDKDYMGYLGANESGFMDFNTGMYLSYALTDTFSVGGKLVWTSIVDGDARDSVDHQDLLWGGVNLAASF